MSTSLVYKLTGKKLAPLNPENMSSCNRQLSPLQFKCTFCLDHSVSHGINTGKCTEPATLQMHTEEQVQATQQLSLYRLQHMHWGGAGGNGHPLSTPGLHTPQAVLGAGLLSIPSTEAETKVTDLSRPVVKQSLLLRALVLSEFSRTHQQQPYLG